MTTTVQRRRARTLRPWNTSEIAWLRERREAGVRLAVIAAELNRTAVAVACQAMRMGLPTTYYWTEEQDALLLKLRGQNIRLVRIGEQLTPPRTEIAVKNRLRVLALRKRAAGGHRE